MRTKFQILAVVCVIASLASCKKDQKGAEADRSLTAGVQPTPCATCGQPKGNFTFAPNTVITGTRTLCPDTTYYLNGKTWVAANAKIVIPAGTVIKGIKKAAPADASALVITQGGKIEAGGTATCPVIFTSQTDTTGSTPAPGDWGGVVLLGRAPINVPGGTAQIEGITSAPVGVTSTYGGNISSDTSGFMRFVRIQFAGALVSQDNELNSLTLGGVGCGTDLHHIETFKGADDGFEFFGGTVNARYLLALANNDDQFDFDLGYSGHIQYAVSILDPTLSSGYSANSNGIECDNEGTSPFTNTPLTKPVLSNFTIVGTSNGSATGTLLAGAQFRRNTRFIFRNSVVYGYPTGLLLDVSAAGNTAKWVDTSNISRTCTPPDSSQFYNNVVYGTVAGANPASGWKLHSSNVVGISASPSIVFTSNFPSPINNNFATNALRPTGAPALSGANVSGLAGILCGCGYNKDFVFNANAALRHRGGAVDETNAYWLSATWIQRF